MTPAQERNATICAGLLALTEVAPVVEPKPGLRYRLFQSGDFSAMHSDLDGTILLDAHLKGFGKVAAFRVYPGEETFEVISLKVQTLPRWIPLLNANLLPRRSLH